MLNSGSIVQLDSVRFATTTQALQDRVADMASRRSEIGDAVDQLLRSWRGDAATTFRTHWEEWRDGADDVIDELRRNVGAMSMAEADLGRSDGVSVRESSRLQGRLG